MFDPTGAVTGGKFVGGKSQLYCTTFCHIEPVKNSVPLCVLVLGGEEGAGLTGQTYVGPAAAPEQLAVTADTADTTHVSQAAGALQGDARRAGGQAGAGDSPSPCEVR